MGGLADAPQGLEDMGKKLEASRGVKQNSCRVVADWGMTSTTMFHVPVKTPPTQQVSSGCLAPGCWVGWSEAGGHGGDSGRGKSIGRNRPAEANSIIG